MNEDRSRRSIFWPLLLIAIGILLLLNNLNVIPGSAWSLILRLWPLLLIVGGLDGLFRGNGFVGSTLFIGLGVIFLLGNLGLLQQDVWYRSLRLWPVLLIAWGLDIVFRKRNWWTASIGIFLGLLLVGGMVIYLLIPDSFSQSLRTITVSRELEGAESTEINLAMGTGSLYMNGDAGSELLLEGELDQNRTKEIEQNFEQRGTTAVYELQSGDVGEPSDYWVGGVYQTEWDLSITNAVPVTMTTDLVLGEQYLDLRKVILDGLTVDTVLGRNVLILPVNETGRSTNDLSIVIGETVIFIPENKGVQIQVDTGLVIIDYPEGYQRVEDTIEPDGEISYEVTVEQPIGILRIEEYSVK